MTLGLSENLESVAQILSSKKKGILYLIFLAELVLEVVLALLVWNTYNCFTDESVFFFFFLGKLPYR